jgi:acetate---CoA ligase (ADP-forming)
MSAGEGGLDRLFAPRGIAVVGASASPEKAGHAMLRALADFDGWVVGINPRADGPILGRPVFASLSEAPPPIDLAIVCVPPAGVPDAIADAARAGVGAAVVCTGGMAEAGGAGVGLQRRAADAAAASGLRMLGPNTSGFLVPRRRLFASFVPAAAEIPAGPVGVVAQSGGVCHALAFLLGDRRCGVSLAVGLGNAADVDAAAVLDHLASDPETRAIALHLEGIRDGRRLTAAVARAAAVKPVVALKVGRSDVDGFAQSHTGALLGSFRLARSALVQAGAVVVDDVEELVDAVSALARVRLRPGAPGVGLLTGQAGPGLLIADQLTAAGVPLPELASATTARVAKLLPPITFQRNPVDSGRPGPAFREVATAVGDDPAIDLVAVYALHEPPALDPVAALVPPPSDRAAYLFVTGGPRAACEESAVALEAAGVPVFDSPGGGARAVAALVRDARGMALAQARAASERPSGDGGAAVSSSAASAVAGEDLRPVCGDEAATKALVQRLGIRCPRRVVCETHAEALEALRQLETPVAVKVLDPAIQHKTEAGGVILGVASEEELAAALAAIDRISAAHRYLVEEMAPSGVDLLVGAARDPAFGTTVVLGLGGVTAEALEDVAVRTVPLTEVDVAEMVQELDGAALLRGFRGLPSVDPDALATVVLALGELLHAHPELAEIELNPLRATRSGLIALDALAVLSR